MKDDVDQSPVPSPAVGEIGEEMSSMLAERVREDFPILKQTVYGKPLVYLDSAATSQKPRRVIDALVRYYQEYNANIHRGIYRIAEEATMRYEQSRGKIAAFIGATRPEEVVFPRRAAGPPVLADAARGVRHMPVGVGDVGADLVAFSAHKMCGPTGAGVLWARYDLRDPMPPFHGGGEITMLVQLKSPT